jgi:hypothetical protein
MFVYTLVYLKSLGIYSKIHIVADSHVPFIVFN